MRTLLITAALAAAVTTRAAEPAASPATEPAQAAAAEAKQAARAKATPAKADLKVAPKPEGKGATAGSTKAEPPKAPDTKPCEPVKPCSID